MFRGCYCFCACSLRCWKLAGHWDRAWRTATERYAKSLFCCANLCIYACIAVYVIFRLQHHKCLLITERGDSRCRRPLCCMTSTVIGAAFYCGSSVNDGVNGNEFSMHYIKLDQIIHMVAKYGPGAMMAKFDVELAYRNVAILPEDRYHLGMKWQGQFYFHLAFRFGLCSAPFNAVADMVEWIIINRYNMADLMNYQNNHMTAGPACCMLVSWSSSSSQQVYCPVNLFDCLGNRTRLVAASSSRQTGHAAGADPVIATQTVVYQTPTQVIDRSCPPFSQSGVAWTVFLCCMTGLLYCFRSCANPIPLGSQFHEDIQIFFPLGMVWAFGCSLACLLPQMWR